MPNGQHRSPSPMNRSAAAPPSTGVNPPGGERDVSDPVPVVSFIVPVRNDAGRLAQCLASIRAVDYPGDRLEIVVADNGSTDGSGAIAREAGAEVLSLPRLRVAEMRNLAVQHCHGEIV